METPSRPDILSIPEMSIGGLLMVGDDIFQLVERSMHTHGPSEIKFRMVGHRNDLKQPVSERMINA